MVTWTNVKPLSIGPLRANFNDFYFTHLKIPSAKSQLFCPGHNVLTSTGKNVTSIYYCNIYKISPSGIHEVSPRNSLISYIKRLNRRRLVRRVRVGPDSNCNRRQNEILEVTEIFHQHEASVQEVDAGSTTNESIVNKINDKSLFKQKVAVFYHHFNTPKGTGINRLCPQIPTKF